MGSTSCRCQRAGLQAGVMAECTAGHTSQPAAGCVAACNRCCMAAASCACNQKAVHNAVAGRIGVVIITPDDCTAGSALEKAYKAA